MDYKDWTEQQKVAHVLEALSREDISPEVVGLIQDWILSKNDTEEKNEILDTILDRMFYEHAFSARGARESLSRLHEKLGLPRLDAQDGYLPDRTPGYYTVRMKQRPRARRVLLRVAAVMLPLAVSGGALWFALKPDAGGVSVPAMVEMARGEDGVVTLPDGSTIRPIADSRVAMAANFADNRRVSLSGEAFFSVAIDASRPFVVEAERLTVTVLGTEFNMKAWPGEAEKVISLVTGSVEIGNGKENVTLAPMEQLVYDSATESCSVSPFTSGQIDRWRFGEREIDDMSLDGAIGAVGDFYGKEVVFEGTPPEGLGVTIVLSDTVTAESALEAIRLTSNAFNYIVEGDIIRISWGER